MDPKGPPANQPTPTANAPTPVATNPLNGRPIFLNTLAMGTLATATDTPASSTTSATALPTIGPATAPGASKPATGANTKIQSFSLHFAMCTDNCSSAFTLTGIVLVLFLGSIIFMFMHYKRRNRDDAEEPMVSVDTKFTGGGAMGRDLKSPFDNTKGFNSFDEYNQRNVNTDSYYEDDYVEGYAGVAGFAPLKDNRQSSHAGIGGFGIPKPQSPMPALPAIPPPPLSQPAPYEPEFADYEDEWERFQQEEAAAAAAAAAGDTPQPYQPSAYRGGHDSTVEGAYFAPQAYEQGHEEDIDEDHAFEPSPYFQANPIQHAEEEEQEHYAMPMPQFEVEDYYMRDHLAADPVAPTANAPNVQITWMNSEQDKNY